MNLPNSLKTPVHRCQNNLNSSNFSLGKVLKKAFLGISMSVLSFWGVAQTVSIGSPVNGIEGSSSMSFVVSLDSGVVNNSGIPITGGIAYTGTATMNSDYVGQMTFSIPNGAGSVSVVLNVIDDIDVECTETVTATIFGVSAGAILNATATADIIDDECGSFTVSIGTPVDGVEGSSDAGFTVELDNGMINNTGAPITGMVTYSGSATPGLDYIEQMSFVIPNGAGSTSLSLSVIDDMFLECTETITATISGLSAGSIGNGSSTTAIFDDECASLTISIGYPEDGAEASADGSFIVYLDGGLINQTGMTITGSLDLGGGTAIPSDDFTGMAIFNIPDGDSATQIPINVVDDLIPEGTETVVGTISNATIGAISSAGATSTLNIIDNDSILSIGENDLIELSIHPNPMSSEFKLKSEIQLMSYVMLDMNGRVVSSDELKTKEVTIDASELPAGVYVLEVLLENGAKVTRKVIKE